MIVSQKALGTWFSQVTTGHGAAVIAGTVGSVLMGTLSWPAAIPALVAGVILAVWPEARAGMEGAFDTATAPAPAPSQGTKQ